MTSPADGVIRAFPRARDDRSSRPDFLAYVRCFPSCLLTTAIALNGSAMALRALACARYRLSLVSRSLEGATEDLLAVANRCIVQFVLERTQPWLVMPPLKEPSAVNRLSDLL